MLGKMMRFITCFARRASAAAAACSLVWGSPALANEDRWKTAASGVWSTGSNWVDGSTPGNGDEATFNVGGAYTVTFNADPLAIQKLTLTTGAVTFTSSSFLQPSTVRVTTGTFRNVRIDSVLTLGSAGGIFQPDKPLHLIADSMDVNGSGALTVRFGSEINARTTVNGTLTVVESSRVMSASGSIGIGSIGAASVLGNGSQWINSGTLGIGVWRTDGIGQPAYDGDGTLLISGGGLVECYDGKVGGVPDDFLAPSMTSTNGVVTVTGSGSFWNMINNLDIGDRALGTVNVQPGGAIRVGGQTVLHPGGRVRLQGGTLETGELSFSGGGQMEWTSGRFSVGVFHGHLGNYGNGVLAPGHSAGSTAITGNYEQSVSGALEIEVGGAAQAAQYDVVNVTGLAILGGQLDLKLINGFTPSPDQTFVIMTAASISGAFANAASGQRVTPSNGGGSFLINYGAGSAFDPTLMVLSDFRVGGIPGDFDDDGDVDRDDLLQWQGDFGQNGLSDDDDDGDSDGADFLVWQRNLSGPAGPAASVPEPGGLILFWAGAFALGLLTRQFTGRTAPCLAFN